MNKPHIFLLLALSVSTLFAHPITDVCQATIHALQKYDGSELCLALESSHATLSAISNTTRPDELDSELDILIMVLAELSNKQTYGKTFDTLNLTYEQAKKLAIIEAKTCLIKLKFVRDVTMLNPTKDVTMLNPTMEVYLEKLAFVKDYLTFVSQNKKTTAYKNIAYTYNLILDANRAIALLNGLSTENRLLPYGLPTKVLATYGETYQNLYKELKSLHRTLKLEKKGVKLVHFLPKPCDDYAAADPKFTSWFTTY